MQKVRLDKWLWAARFFRTRSLAKQAIEGGKVHWQGKRCKTSKEIAVNDELSIRQGWDEKVVVVTALSDQRRGATEAALLYEETPESLRRREEDAARRRAERATNPTPDGRPSKIDRRQIHRFRRKMQEHQE